MLTSEVVAHAQSACAGPCRQSHYAHGTGSHNTKYVGIDPNRADRARSGCGFNSLRSQPTCTRRHTVDVSLQSQGTTSWQECSPAPKHDTTGNKTGSGAEIHTSCTYVTACWPHVLCSGHCNRPVQSQNSAQEQVAWDTNRQPLSDIARWTPPPPVKCIHYKR